MEILVFIIGMGITIIMVLILLSGFMQDMDWYDNKAAFEDARKPAAPRKVPVSERKPLTQLIKWMDYHV